MHSLIDRVLGLFPNAWFADAYGLTETVSGDTSAVLETAVVARPDPRWGEVPVAYVVFAEGESPGAGELAAHCGERLARFKVPKDFVAVDALPRNPTGKVLKRSLRDREYEKADRGPGAELSADGMSR